MEVDGHDAHVFKDTQIWTHIVNLLAIYLLDRSDEFPDIMSIDDTDRTAQDCLKYEMHWIDTVLKASLCFPDHRFTEFLPAALRALSERNLHQLALGELTTMLIECNRMLFEYQQFQLTSKRSSANEGKIAMIRLADFVLELKSFIMDFMTSGGAEGRYMALKILYRLKNELQSYPSQIMLVTVLQLVEATSSDEDAGHTTLVQILYEHNRALKMHIGTCKQLRQSISTVFQTSAKQLHTESPGAARCKENLAVLLMMLSVMKSDIVDISQIQSAFDLLLIHMDPMSLKMCAFIYVAALIQQRLPVLERIIAHIFITYMESTSSNNMTVFLDFVKCLVALIMDNDAEFFASINRLAGLEFTDAIQRYADVKLLLRQGVLKNHLIHSVCNLWTTLKHSDSILSSFLTDVLAVNHTVALHQKLLLPAFNQMSSRLLSKEDCKVIEKIMPSFVRDNNKAALEITNLECIDSTVFRNQIAIMLMQAWEVYKMISSPQMTVENRFSCSFEVRQKLETCRNCIRRIPWSLVFDTLSKSKSTYTIAFAAKLKHLLILVYPQVMQCMTDAQMESLIPTPLISADLTRQKIIDILRSINMIAKSSPDEISSQMIVGTWYSLMRKTSEYLLIQDTLTHLFGSDLVQIEQALADPFQLFKLPEWIFQCLPVYKIFLTILKFACSAMKHHNVIIYLQRSQELISPKDDNESQIKKVQSILAEYDVSILVMESSVIQRLLNLITPTDLRTPDGDKLIIKLQKLTFNYISSRYIEDKRIAKLVNFQGFAQQMVSVYCKEVRVLYSYLAYVQEQLDSSDYTVRLFACLLGSHLGLEYKSKSSLEISMKVYEQIEVMVKHLEKNPGMYRYRFRNSLAPPQNFSHPMLDDLPIMIDCIVNISKAYPHEQFIRQFVPEILKIIHTIISTKSTQQPLSAVEVQVISLAVNGFESPPDLLGEMKNSLLNHLQKASEEIRTLIMNSVA